MGKPIKRLAGQARMFDELFTPITSLKVQEGQSKTISLKTAKRFEYQNPATKDAVTIPEGTKILLGVAKHGEMYSAYGLQIGWGTECTATYGRRRKHFAKEIPGHFSQCPHATSVKGVILACFSVFVNQFTQCDGNDGRKNDVETQRYRARDMGIQFLTAKEFEDANNASS